LVAFGDGVEAEIFSPVEYQNIDQCSENIDQNGKHFESRGNQNRTRDNFVASNFPQSNNKMSEFHTKHNAYQTKNRRLK